MKQLTVIFVTIICFAMSSCKNFSAEQPAKTLQSSVAISGNKDEKKNESNQFIKAAKDGWWIKVNTNRTEASQIAFEIGTDGNNRKFWRNWNSGDANEFDVPIEYRNVAELYIHASSNPSDKNSWFCMMYRTNGVKHFDFDDDEDHKEKQSDHDDECN